MTEVESFPIDLIMVDSFAHEHNLKWSVSDLANGVELVFSSDCPDNIENCLTNTGTLAMNVAVDLQTDIKLGANTENVNNNFMYITESLDVTIDDNFDVKGLFLRVKSNGYVMGYMINQKPMRFCNKIMFEADNVLVQLVR